VQNISSTAVIAADIYLKVASGANGWEKIITGPAISQIPQTATVTALSDGDATLTAAQILTRLFTITPGAARTLTTPTAANLVAAIPNVAVGDTIEFTVVNNAASTHAATLAAGSGVTNRGIAAHLAVAAATARTYLLRFENVTSSTEAVGLYPKN
jgi:hypothetical protein